jgi:hypothetical protein
MFLAMRRAAAILALLALGACAPEPTPRVGADGDVLSARRQLARIAADRAVPLEILGAPPGLEPTFIAREAARGVRGLQVRFAPLASPADPLRLVLLFDPLGGPPGSAVCAGHAESTGRGAAAELRAVFCDGAVPLAEVATRRDGGSVDRLIWRTTGFLFPDDYAETYGFNLFGYRVRLGGELTF